jgi:hypothetical protein
VSPSASSVTSTGTLTALITAASPTTQVSLCVAVQPTHASIERGHAAQWTVKAWTQGGNVPHATISLAAAPASLKPKYSVGCGGHDGTALCDLGAVDVKSAKRELQAQVAVPVTATTVTSVRLTVIASAADLPKKPKVSATVKVTAPAPGAVVPAPVVGPPVVSTTPLSIGALPFLPFLPSSTLRQGGNAAGLFPTLTPSTDPPASNPASQNGSTTPVANTFALSQGASVVGGQLAGLGVLALGLVLAVTRLSVRKRPARASAAESGKPADGSAKPADGSAKPADGAQSASGDAAEPQARTDEPPPAPPAEPSQSAGKDPEDQA